MHDTPVDIEQRMAQMMARRTPAERLRMASSMFDFGRNLVIAGLKREYPALNEAQLRTRMFLRLYSDDFTHIEIKRIIKRIPNMQWDSDLE